MLRAGTTSLRQGDFCPATRSLDSVFCTAGRLFVSHTATSSAFTDKVQLRCCTRLSNCPVQLRSCYQIVCRLSSGGADSLRHVPYRRCLGNSGHVSDVCKDRNKQRYACDSLGAPGAIFRMERCMPLL